MTIIRHFDAAKGTVPVFVKDVPSETCLLDFLIENFDPNFAGLSAAVYVNGVLLYDTKDGGSAEELDLKTDFLLEPFDRVDIITYQAGLPTWAIYTIIAVVSVAASLLLAPSFSPGNAEQQGSSPNSKLNAATNEFRPDEAIPEIFGSPVCYPDFVQPSWYVYDGNLKIQREMFSLGVGEYDIEKVRSGDTDLNQIPSSLLTIYQPNELPPADQRLIVRETNEITSQSLEAPNSDAIGGVFNGGDTTVISSAGNSIVKVGEDIIANLGLRVGDYVGIKVTETSSGGSETVVLSGFWNITNITATTITLPTGDDYNSAPDSTSKVEVEKTDSSGAIDNWVGWYTTSGTNNQEVWFHVAMPRGIRTESGGKLKVDFLMEIRQVDQAGLPIVGGYTATQAQSIEGNSLDPQYRTYYFTGAPAGIYQGRIRRTSNDLGNASSELVELEQLVGVEYQSEPNYGNVTLLWIERKASERIVSGRQSKVNLDLTRKLPYFNRITGLLETNNLVATRDFADAAAYTLIVAGKRDPSTIDLAGLYAINDALPENLRSFDFTFDDKDVSMAERVQTICDVARVLPFRAYQNWFFERDEKKPFPVALYNRRNISRTSSVKQSFKQFLPSEKDSISLTYVSLPDNIKKTIHRSVSDGVIVNTVGLYPKEIKLPGCQSLEQAENRIDVEIRKLIYAKRTAEIEILHDGFSGKITDRVRFADINDADIFDGEILDIFGDEYLTSEPFNPVAGKNYFVQITNDDGVLTNLVSCQPLSYTKKGFKAAGLVGGYTADNEIIQLGSRYIISDDDEQKGTDFIITDIQADDSRTMTVSLAAYSDKIYEMDS